MASTGAEECDSDYLGECVEAEVIDVDKLLVLVKARPELYDISKKDYHNQDVIAKAWHVIGRSMNVSSSACKNKWHILRSSYGRYLRHLKKTPSGSSGKKKKWYLAEAMSFLFPYMAAQKNSKSNMKRKSEEEEVEEDVATAIEGGEETECVEGDEEDDNNGGPDSNTSTANYTAVAEIMPKKRKGSIPAELLAEPTAPYITSITYKKPTLEEHPMLIFIKGLMPDIIKLSDHSQRRLKSDFLNALNFYLDAQDGEPSQLGYSRPSSSNSTSASHLSAFKTENSPQDVQNVLEACGYQTNPHQ